MKGEFSKHFLSFYQKETKKNHPVFTNITGIEFLSFEDWIQQKKALCKRGTKSNL